MDFVTAVSLVVGRDQRFEAGRCIEALGSCVRLKRLTLHVEEEFFESLESRGRFVWETELGDADLEIVFGDINLAKLRGLHNLDLRAKVKLDYRGSRARGIFARNVQRLQGYAQQRLNIAQKPQPSATRQGFVPLYTNPLVHITPKPGLAKAKDLPGSTENLVLTDKPAVVKCLDNDDIPDTLSDFARLAKRDMASVFEWVKSAKARLEKSKHD